MSVFVLAFSTIVAVLSTLPCELRGTDASMAALIAIELRLN
ncbi:MAG: hypothetical protein WBR18_11230 [Anaerolineales bacterium]